MPPNILLVVSDQQQPELLGFRGKIPVETPHLDRLAAEGTCFERAYTPCPLCTPARASLLTGQYPSRHGAWSIGVPTPRHIPTLPQRLSEAAGYRTAIIGKSHFEPCMLPGSPETPPASQDWAHFRNWSGPWFGFEYARINVGHGHEPHAYSMHYGVWLKERGIEPVEPFFYPRRGEHHDPIWALPEEYHSSTWVADETIRYLESHSASKENRPFYLCVNFQDPHCPLSAPENWFNKYRTATPPQPNRRIDEIESNGTTLYRATLEGRLLDLGWHESARPPGQHSLGMLATPDWSPVELNHWRAYMAMQALLDHHFGRILSALDDLRLSDNTLVIYTSDHGDYMGHHWLTSKGGSHYDEAIRVPLLARWPGRIPEGVTSAALQSLVDLPRTFLGIAGVPVDAEMQGLDQLTCWGGGAAVRQGVWIDHRVERGLTVNSWITESHRLSLHSIIEEGRDEIELYDLAEDPGETTNIASHQPATALMLAQQLLRYQAAVSGPWQPRLAFA